MASKRPPAPPPTAKHLTATTRVLRTHFARPAFLITEAAPKVKELALLLGTGEPTKDDLVLEEKLRKATSVSIADLAHFAEDWPHAGAKE